MHRPLWGRFLFFGWSIYWLTVTDCFGGALVSMSYHLVVDSATFHKSPRDYESIVYDPKGARLQVYVKKASSRQIAGQQIESVSVRKERRFGNSPEEIKAMEQMIREKLSKHSKNGSEANDYPHGFFYSIAFKLTPAEWKRDMEFVNKNLGKRFQVKVGSQDFGLAEFIDPLEPESMMIREITFYTGENDPLVIKKMLSGFHNVVFLN